MSTTIAQPDGDGTKTNWEDAALGTSNLFSNVNEGTTSPNDATYVVTSTTSPIFFTLQDMPSDFSIATAVSIVIRALKSGSGSRTITVQIFQSDESTALTGTAVSGALSAGFANFTLTPTVTGATDKATWNGARLKITPTSGGSPDTQISVAQPTITYTAAANVIPNQIQSGGNLQARGIRTGSVL